MERRNVKGWVCIEAIQEKNVDEVAFRLNQRIAFIDMKPASRQSVHPQYGRHSKHSCNCNPFDDTHPVGGDCYFGFRQIESSDWLVVRRA
jgi:hypothetical protein